MENRLLQYNGKILAINGVPLIQYTINFRIPTEAEWEAERLSWATNNAAGAFGSVLKLPMAGGRMYIDGSTVNVDITAYYWSSAVNGTVVRNLRFFNTNAVMGDNWRAYGFSVRLIKEGDYTAGTYVAETMIIDGLTYNTVFNSTTGKVWLDRNLGATQVATSSTDANSYGWLYQWGRGTDGHQIRTSGTTSTLSSSDTPGHGDFILINSSPYDWRSPQNDNLWQGVNGINNPGSPGIKLKT